MVAQRERSGHVIQLERAPDPAVGRDADSTGRKGNGPRERDAQGSPVRELCVVHQSKTRWLALGRHFLDEPQLATRPSDQRA